MVADPRIDRNRDHEGVVLPRRRLGQRVFGVERESVQIRQHAEHGLAGFFLQPVDAGLEQAPVAAKAIDDEALDPVLLGARKAVERADDMREDPAAIDVGDKDHRAVGSLGESHVGDVVRPQIDFRGAAGAFHDHGVELGAQARKGCEHLRHEFFSQREKLFSLQLGIRLPAENDLRARVAGGL